MNSDTYNKKLENDESSEWNSEDGMTQSIMSSRADDEMKFMEKLK